MRRFVLFLAVLGVSLAVAGCGWNFRDPLHPQACYGGPGGCGCGVGCR
jgi:hypothetical protein